MVGTKPSVGGRDDEEDIISSRACRTSAMVCSTCR